MIAVAATNRSDTLASFSDYGRRTVHVGAPGVDIISTVPGGSYATWSGTSMATPHVVGAAALLKAYDPTLDWAAIKNRIIAGGDRVTSMVTTTISGRRLNAYGALTCAGQEVNARIAPDRSVFLAVGETVTFAVLHIVCANPGGPVSLTIDNGPALGMHDDGLDGDEAVNDGVYTFRWKPPAAGRYTAQLPDGDTVSVNVMKPYIFETAEYEWRTFAGRRLSLSDESSLAFTPSFPVRFGGVAFSRRAIDSNGGIRMLGPLEPAGFGIPSSSMLVPTALADALVAPFWDDLVPWADRDRNVYLAVLGSPPNRELVIEWRGIRHYCEFGWPPANGSADFQVVFSEASDDVLFNYADTTFDNELYDYGAQASVGIQVSSSVGMQFSCWAPLLAPQTTVRWRTVEYRPTSIELLWPNGGEVWQPGRSESIGWSASGPAATTFRIELLKGDTLETVIAASVPAAGTPWYRWTMPEAQAHGHDYKIRLVSNSDPSVSHSSARNFSVEDLSNMRRLSVLLPGYSDGTVTSSPEGLQCRRGCDAFFPVGTTVTLTPTADAGSRFTGWTGACSGSGACVVSLDADAYVEAEFVVISTIIITAPNGGEQWAVGTTQTIRWEFNEPADRTGYIGLYEVFPGGGARRGGVPERIAGRPVFRLADSPEPENG